MKEYNRKTKRWEYPEVKTENVNDLKREVLCKGKLPHNYALVLPEYLQTKNPDIAEDIVEKYYQSEDRIADLSAIEEKFKQSIGLSIRSWDRKPSRHYECTTCGKKAINIYDKQH